MGQSSYLIHWDAARWFYFPEWGLDKWRQVLVQVLWVCVVELVVTATKISHNGTLHVQVLKDETPAHYFWIIHNVPAFHHWSRSSNIWGHTFKGSPHEFPRAAKEWKLVACDTEICFHFWLPAMLMWTGVDSLSINHALQTRWGHIYIRLKSRLSKHLQG